ncbi:hypothetical protein [Gemmiger qucibialis]|uniref:hypothetical protein n=1 Tax=Gemmiger qucibialis TaxID=2997294 RepID=UPI0022E58DFA|nr:hypothetical protein [Gemmiger qucibialis]
MSILAQIIGLACLLFWGFWLCCKLRLPAGFAPLCGLCFCMVVLQLAGSCNQLWLGVQLLLVGAVLTLAQRRRHEILPQLLSPGVLAFCSAAGVLMAVFAIRQPEFQTWDEFSHWGIYFKSVFYQHRFAVWDTTRSLAHQAYPQGLPGLYALFALPAAQYREADVLFVTALPLAAAASALFALPQVTARRPRIAYTVCACLAAPALFWRFTPDTPYTTAYMDAPVGALFAAAFCVILLPCAANSRVQRGLALALLCGALTTVKEIGTVFALCVVGIWFLQCLLDALRDKGGILRGFLLPFAAALPCFAIPLAWKLLLKALHRADDQFSSMGPGYFLQCWQEARTGFDRYFYDVWDRYYARLRSYPLLFGASTFKVGCLCAAAAVLLLIVLIWAMGRRQGLRTALPGLCMILYWPLYQGVLFYVYICGMSLMRHWRWPAGSGTSAAFSSAGSACWKAKPAGRVCCGPPPAANGRACGARHCSLPAGLQHALGHLASGRCCIPLLPAESRLAHRAATDRCRHANPHGRRTEWQHLAAERRRLDGRAEHVVLPVRAVPRRYRGGSPEQRN